LFESFNIVTSLQTKIFSTTHPSPVQQRKGTMPSSVTPDSGAINIGKKLWNKVFLNKFIF
jgi:hypothetical protein